MEDSETDRWFVDRSRVEAGRRCPRLRFLSFHAEAEEDARSGLKVISGYGRGLRTVAASLPLVTGTHVHSIFAALLWGEHADDAIARVVAEYRAQTAPFLEVMERTAETGDAALEEQRATVREQAWLVECLGWVLALRVVPALLETWEVVQVETEVEFDIDPLILFMPRPDAVVRHRRSGRLAVLDLKTTADANAEWFMSQWQTTPQLNVACRGVEERLGEECSSYYVMALEKGSRKQDKDWGEYVGAKKQQTPLCYAYLRESPMEAQEWRASYYVPAFDEMGEPIINPKTGKQRKEGSTEKAGWHRVAVWEHAASARAFVEGLPEAFIASVSKLIGPIECKGWLIDSYLEGVRHEEYRMWIPLAQRLSALAAEGAPQEEIYALLDELAPQSWDCVKYGRNCEFREACLRTPGGLDRFAPRVPHHEAERVRFVEAYGEEGVPEEREE